MHVCNYVCSYLEQHSAVLLCVWRLDVVGGAGVPPAGGPLGRSLYRSALQAAGQAVATHTDLLLLLKAWILQDALRESPTDAAHTGTATQFPITHFGLFSSSWLRLHRRGTQRVISNDEFQGDLNRAALAVQEIQPLALYLVLPKLVDAVVDESGRCFLVVDCHLATVKHLKLLRVVKRLFSLLLGLAVLLKCYFSGLSDAADDFRNLEVCKDDNISNYQPNMISNNITDTVDISASITQTSCYKELHVLLQRGHNEASLTRFIKQGVTYCSMGNCRKKSLHFFYS